jgi:threonyl-tRNA synthetase
MAPVQAALLPINDELIPYASEIKDILEKEGIRTELDGRTESLKKKIRDAQLNYVPLIITCGPKEKESKTISVRNLSGKIKYGIVIDEFIKIINFQIKERKPDLEIFNDG